MTLTQAYAIRQNALRYLQSVANPRGPFKDAERQEAIAKARKAYQNADTIFKRISQGGIHANDNANG